MIHEISFEEVIDSEDVIVEAELILFPALQNVESDWDSENGYDIFSFRVYSPFNEQLIIDEMSVVEAIDKYIREVSITKIMLDNESF